MNNNLTRIVHAHDTFVRTVMSDPHQQIGGAVIILRLCYNMPWNVES